MNLTMIRTVKDKLIFLGEFIRTFKTTGSFFPTSKHAAAALSAPIREVSKNSKHILELGPGTGSVTVKILEDMGPEDTLDVCEINPRFMRALKERLARLDSFERHKSRIHFYLCAAEELPEMKQYDVIVCALPFLNFPPALVEAIFEKMKTLSHSDTVVTYYEYMGFRKLGMALSPRERREKLREINSIYLRMQKEWRYSKVEIWKNVMPINVFRLEKAA